jgi:hypothetical protein
MPESFTFCAFTPGNFPETRDSHDVIVGYVVPGDVRDFDAAFSTVAPQAPKDGPAPPWFPAPTADWFPSGGPLPNLNPDGGAEKPAEPPAAPAPKVAAKPAASVAPPAATPESDD